MTRLEWMGRQGLLNTPELKAELVAEIAEQDRMNNERRLDHEAMTLRQKAADWLKGKGWVIEREEGKIILNSPGGMRLWAPSFLHIFNFLKLAGCPAVQGATPEEFCR